MLGQWQRSDVKDKAILGVFFIPALFSVGGLLVCIAYFVLFKLPSFLLSVLGWLLLISLFSGGGLFFYEKLNGKRVSDSSRYTTFSAQDAAAENPSTASGNAETGKESEQKNWFDGVRKMKWPQ